MNRKQKIIVSVIGIFLVLLALVGLTYAYFLTQIKGNTNNKSISVTTAKLELIYEDGNGILTPASKIEPGDKIEFLDKDGNKVESKIFTVTNNGNATVDDYGVVLENFKATYYSNQVIENENGEEVTIPVGSVTELSRPEDFKLTITCVNQDKEECTGFNGTLPTESDILIRNSIKVGETQTYTATLTYAEAGVDQSADMNKTISGKFNIIGIEDTIDIKGTVTAYESGDYVQANSTKRVSPIYPDGTYKLLGLEAGTHKIKVCGSDVSDCTEDKAKMVQTLSIIKGKTSSVDNTSKTITMTETSRLAIVDINVSNKTLTLGSNIVDEEINWNNAPSGTLLNALKNNNEVISGVPTKSDDIYITSIDELEFIATTTSIFNVNSKNDYIIYATDINKQTMTYVNINQCQLSSTECQNAVMNKYAIKISSTSLSDEELRNLEMVKSWEVNIVKGIDLSVLEYSSEAITSDLYEAKTTGEVINYMMSMNDDYGKSYYFRGSGETNHVNFLDKCWRVLRVQGNGKIKLVLDDKDHLCDSEAYQANNGSVGSADYGYKEVDGNLIADYLNTENRTTSMKYVLEDWYNKNLKDKTSLVENNKWCYQNSDTNFNTLKCNNEYAESFIGTFTADELSLAAGPVFTYSSNVKEGYIYYKNQVIKTLSKNMNFTYMYNEYYGESNSMESTAVIPVITIKSTTPLSTTTTKDQNGTKNNPYVID